MPAQGRVVSLPVLIDRHIPDLDYLPKFVAALALKADYQTEKACFRSIAAILADFYRVQLPLPPLAEARAPSSFTRRVAPPEDQAREWSVRHLILPELKRTEVQRARRTDGSIVEVTRLENLYKIFERC